MGGWVAAMSLVFEMKHKAGVSYVKCKDVERIYKKTKIENCHFCKLQIVSLLISERQYNKKIRKKRLKTFNSIAHFGLEKYYTDHEFSAVFSGGQTKKA